MKPFTLLSLVLLLITSCTSKITNQEAENEIRGLYPKQCYSKKIRTVSYYSPSTKTRMVDKEALKVFRAFEAQKLVDIKTKKYGFTANPNIDYTIRPTQHSKNLYGNGFPISEVLFDRISSISQTEKEAVVRYIVKRKKLPFYRLHILHDKYQKRHKQLECQIGEWEEEITLIKFDTGWKVK